MDFVTDDVPQPIDVGFVAEVQRTDSPRCSNCGNAVLAGEFCAECGTKNPVDDGLENVLPSIGSHLPLLQDNEAGAPDVLVVPVVALAEVAADDTGSSLVAAQADVGTAADVHAAWLDERGLGQYADALQVRRPRGCSLCHFCEQLGLKLLTSGGWGS